MMQSIFVALGAHAGLVYGFVATLILSVFLKPLRDVLKFLFSAPAQIIATRLWFLLTSLLKAHWFIIKNLITPRSVMFPTLDRKGTKK